MNLVEYLHFQARLGTKLLASSRNMSPNDLQFLLEVLNNKPARRYISKYSSPLKEHSHAKDDIIIAQEMQKFFRTGILPSSFIFEYLQEEFTNRTTQLVQNGKPSTEDIQIKKSELPVHPEIVNIISSPEESLKVDIKNNSVGEEFRVKLARKVCFLMDSLFHLLGLQTSVFDDIEPDTRFQVKTIKLKENEFFGFSKQIFSDCRNELQDSQKIDLLERKLETLYEIYQELRILFDSGDRFQDIGFLFGLKCDWVLDQLEEFKEESKQPGLLERDIGNLTCIFIIGHELYA